MTPIVRDPMMRQLYERVDRIAHGMISVLLLGETGVGKEVLAEAIHRRSPRSSKEFLCLNCAALSESIVESELSVKSCPSVTPVLLDPTSIVGALPTTTTSSARSASGSNSTFNRMVLEVRSATAPRR